MGQMTEKYIWGRAHLFRWHEEPKKLFPTPNSKKELGVLYLVLAWLCLAWSNTSSVLKDAQKPTTAVIIIGPHISTVHQRTARVWLFCAHQIAPKALAIKRESLLRMSLMLFYKTQSPFQRVSENWLDLFCKNPVQRRSIHLAEITCVTVIPQTFETKNICQPLRRKACIGFLHLQGMFYCLVSCYNSLQSFLEKRWLKITDQ